MRRVRLPLGSLLSGDLVNVGRAIREHREARGLTQGELAQRLGRTQTALSYWESGKRAPGLEDLITVAQVLDVELVDLIPARRDRTAGVLLRAAVQDVDAGELGIELSRFAEAAERLVVPKSTVAVRPSTARDAAENLLEAYGWTGRLPIDIGGLAAACGAVVLPWPLGSVDGLVLQVAGGAVIGVNSEQHAPRVRFTIAHEVGHLILRHATSFHVDYGDDLGPSASGEHPDYNWRHERAANTFAACVLMPASAVRQELNKQPNVAKLATRFEVSRSAMSYRVKNLGLTLHE